MANWFFIRLLAPPSPNTQLWELTKESLCEWCAYQKDGQLALGPSIGTLGSVAEKTAAHEQAQRIIIIPGEHVLFTQAVLPANTQKRYLRQALPFVIEEQIAEDVDSQHIVIGPKSDANQSYQVAVVKKEMMSIWLDGLSQLNLTPDAILPDVLLTPRHEGHWSILLEPKRVLIRVGRYDGYTCEPNMLAPVLDSLFVHQQEIIDQQSPQQRAASQAEAEDEEESAELVTATGLSIILMSDEQSPAISELQKKLVRHIPMISPGAEVHSKILSTSALEMLARSYLKNTKEASGMNLLQDTYRGRVSEASGWKRWQSVVMMIAACFIAQVGFDVARGYYLNQQSAELTEAIEQEYLSIFPNSKIPSDIKRIVKSRLEAASKAGSQVGFLQLLSRSTQPIGQLSHPQQLTILSINYSQKRGDLMLDVKAKSFGLLDEYQKILTAAGLVAKLGSINNDADGVRAKINIKGQ